jgi:hypothetical protein
LLFLAATVNYADRQVIGILKPTLQLQGVLFRLVCGARLKPVDGR